MKRNSEVVEDDEGKRIVVIHNIQFKGRQNIDWDSVENYIRRYIGQFVEIMDTGDIVYLGKDLADEYSGSKYTEKLKGGFAKAKANAAQGLPEMIRIATNLRKQKNLAKKHCFDARYGWYRCDTRFALPVYAEEGRVGRYNVYRAELIIRHAADHKLYLYDIINIKKETSTPLEQ